MSKKLLIPKFVTRRDKKLVKPYVAKVIFTKEECEAIVKKAKELYSGNDELIHGTGGKNSARYDIMPEDFPEVYDRIYRFLLEANKTNFRLDKDFVLSEPVYMNEYVDNGYCGWHVDGYTADLPGYRHRKLTCVVQMTDPNEYEGGDFELYSYHGITEDIRQIGTAYIIPSFEWHSVTPITKGTRRSMIMFLEGREQFK